MSELGNKRPIPSRSFGVNFNSAQEIVSPTSSVWLPRIKGDTGSNNKVSFGAGSVNGFLPVNWNEEFSVPASNPRYVKLQVTGSINGISKVEILVEPNPQINNSFREKYPAPTFSFNLGVILGTYYSMIYTAPITVEPRVALQIPKESASPGENPYNIYWHWVITP